MTVAVPGGAGGLKATISNPGMTALTAADSWFTLTVTQNCTFAFACCKQSYRLRVIGNGGGWGDPHITTVMFAQTELLRACWSLQHGEFRIPGDSKIHALPICRLDALGALGPDRKRIHEGFTVSTDDWSPYPGFWGHESAKVTMIRQQPNSRLLVWHESPRGPDDAPVRMVSSCE